MGPWYYLLGGGVLLFGAGMFLGFLLGRRRPGCAGLGWRAGGSRNGTELYVGNLSYNVDEKQLAKIFSDFGPVSSARVISDRISGRSKGYGFVVMADRRALDAAIEGLHGKDLNGRKLIVSEARTKARTK